MSQWCVAVCSTGNGLRQLLHHAHEHLDFGDVQESTIFICEDDVQEIVIREDDHRSPKVRGHGEAADERVPVITYNSNYAPEANQQTHK